MRGKWLLKKKRMQVEGGEKERVQVLILIDRKKKFGM